MFFGPHNVGNTMITEQLGQTKYNIFTTKNIFFSKREWKKSWNPSWSFILLFLIYSFNKAKLEPGIHIQEWIIK